MTLSRHLRPGRIVDAIRRRGIKGAMIHTLRRVGTYGGRALAGPDHLRINPIGALCNHRCPMCWLQHEPRENLRPVLKQDRGGAMSIGDYIGLFDSMPPGLEEVEIVGGGEPMLHPDIEGIMTEIRGRGWRGSIYTNGTLMNERISRAMVEVRWDRLRVSVHGGDRETYRAVQGADKFDRLLENLKQFHQMRRRARAERLCRLIIFHVIQRENLASIEKLFEFAARVGADNIHFEKLIAPNDAMRLTSTETEEACRRLNQYADRCGVPNNGRGLAAHLAAEQVSIDRGEPFRPARRCSVGFDQAIVSSAGDVRPCCFSDEVMGNVHERPFNEVWFGNKMSRFRRRLFSGRFASYCISQRCSIREVLHD